MARRKKKSNILEVFLFIVILSFMIYSNYFNESEAHVFKENTVTDNLEVHFIDVGQADAILIKSKDESMLIDAGNNEDGDFLVNYLKNLGITTFKYVISTHAHEDHIGSMDDIIDNFNIETFYMPDVMTTTNTFENVLDSLQKKNYYFDTPNIGDKFNVGEGEFEVIYVGKDPDDLNDTSIVLRLDHGNNSFLFTGDISSKVENKILNKNINVDVLKVAHHGSKTSTSTTFLKYSHPKYAIISVGENNSYNLPKDKTINRLKNIGANIYRTDELGTIIIESDGNVIQIKTEI